MRASPTRTNLPSTLNRGFFADVGLPNVRRPVAARSMTRASSSTQVSPRTLLGLLGWLTLSFAALAIDRAAGPRSLAFFDSVFHVQRSHAWNLQLVGLGLLLGALSFSLIWVARQKR